MDITSYLLGKESGGGTPINNQNKNVTITENGTTTLTADTGYTGLGTVGITTNVSAGISEYFTTEITNQNKSDFSNNYIKKYPPITIASDVTDLSYAFQNWKYNTINLSSINTSNVTNMAYMFMNSDKITELDLSNLDTSNVTNMNGMFSGVLNLQELDVSDFDTSSLLYTAATFNSIYYAKKIILGDFNFENVETIEGLFGYCMDTTTIEATNLDFSSAIYCYAAFEGCSALQNIPPISNLGKAFSTTAAAHFFNYKMDFSGSEQLTHTSLMNIINGLYDIASKGVQTQDLILGSTNLAKLSQAEIDIATNKGWTVS